MIIEPYGNPMTESYMKHELISTVLKKFQEELCTKIFALMDSIWKNH